MARFIVFLLVLALAASYSRQVAAFAASWDDDDMPQRQKAMKDALEVMFNYDPDTMAEESVQRAMAFVNGELEHLRPIAKAIHKMPENTPAEIRAKKQARAASDELLTRHLSSLLPADGSVKLVDDL
jgi:TolA-binding protein